MHFELLFKSIISFMVVFLVFYVAMADDADYESRHFSNASVELLGGSNFYPLIDNAEIVELEADCRHSASLIIVARGPGKIRFQWKKDQDFGAIFDLISYMNGSSDRSYNYSSPSYGWDEKEYYIRDKNVHRIIWELRLKSSWKDKCDFGSKHSSAYITGISLEGPVQLDASNMHELNESSDDTNISINTSSMLGGLDDNQPTGKPISDNKSNSVNATPSVGGSISANGTNHDLEVYCPCTVDLTGDANLNSSARDDEIICLSNWAYTGDIEINNISNLTIKSISNDKQSLENATVNGCIRLNNTNNVTVEGLIVSGGNEYGIYIEHSNNSSIKGNTISCRDGPGIYISNCSINNASSTNIVDNDIFHESTRPGIALSNSNNTFIKDNSISIDTRNAYLYYLNRSYHNKIFLCGVGLLYCNGAKYGFSLGEGESFFEDDNGNTFNEPLECNTNIWWLC